MFPDNIKLFKRCRFGVFAKTEYIFALHEETWYIIAKQLHFVFDST
jgi:hypothetical protein